MLLRIGVQNYAFYSMAGCGFGKFKSKKIRLERSGSQKFMIVTKFLQLKNNTRGNVVGDGADDRIIAVNRREKALFAYPARM